MLTAKCFPTLQGNVVPSSSGSSNPERVNFRLLHPEDEGTMFLPTPVTIYQLTQCNISEDLNLRCHFCLL